MWTACQLDNHVRFEDGHSGHAVETQSDVNKKKKKSPRHLNMLILTLIHTQDQNLLCTVQECVSVSGCDVCVMGVLSSSACK